MRFFHTAPHFGMLLVLSLALVAGCASYRTPAGGADLAELASGKIKKELQRKPAAPFPATLSIVRLQGPHYDYHEHAYGRGRYTVITTRNRVTEAHLKQIRQWPQVRGLAPINRMILPHKLKSIKQLRLASAKVHADLLLAYTLDTEFRIDEHDIPPLDVITLGFLPNEEAKVTCTAAAAIYDVRTGYVYGLGEATASTSQLASAWDQQEAVEDARAEAEREAVNKLVPAMEKTWQRIVKEYANRSTEADDPGD